MDVLQQLINIDPRFTLHIRGRMPWEYPYIWNKPSEREAYSAFFERFASSTRLSEHVAFEPFGADMGNWLRKVGFVLSPSTSESFHLAPAEGMASGSIPVVWRRDGVHDIFPERFIVPDTTHRQPISSSTTRTIAAGAPPMRNGQRRRRRPGTSLRSALGGCSA